MYLKFLHLSKCLQQQIYLGKLNQATLVEQKAEIEYSQTSGHLYHGILWSLKLTYSRL